MASPQIKGQFIDTDQVLVEERGYARMLTLNRPKQLNALSSEMILKLLKLFTAYEDDPNVKLLIVKINVNGSDRRYEGGKSECTRRRGGAQWKIFLYAHLQGKGRAFCAGGDVSAVANSINKGHWTNGTNYFWNEFILIYIIATYSKPQVSILDGIVMGGGSGVSIHGRFRVATEKSLFAMPETALGLYTDIGSSYFLSRLPGYFGEFVGLTGARLNGSEMLACGLATHFVPSTKLGLLEESLIRVESSDTFTVCGIIDQFAQQMPLSEKSAYNWLNIIDRCFSKSTVEEILSALEVEAAHETADWISVAIESLKKASPTSLKITLRLIREGRKQQVGQCLIQDYRVSSHIMRKELSNDFFEGWRAILVDKDRNPKWNPHKLELIDDNMVDHYFSKVDDALWEDLNLPLRHNSKVRPPSKL